MNYNDIDKCDIKLSKKEWIELFGIDGKSGLVMSYAVKILKSGKLPSYRKYDIEDIWEVTLDVTMYLIKNYKEGELSLTSYLYNWLMKKTIDQIWRETMSYETLDDKEYIPSKEDILKKIQNKNLIKRILDVTSGRDKNIIIMYLAGYSVQDICKTLGISKMTISRMYERIKSKLTNNIDNIHIRTTQYKKIVTDPTTTKITWRH